MSVTALAPWFGSARMIAAQVGSLIGRRDWIGVPFAGGMCEVPQLQARSISVNDLNRHLINLGRVAAIEGENLRKLLDYCLYHPHELEQAQQLCRDIEKHKTATVHPLGSLGWAAAYFCCCWMTRSGAAGTGGEFTGGLSVRWESTGGDSAVRFRSAIESLEEWSKVFRQRNVTFTTLDVFEFLDKCKDEPTHAIYCDPPFLDAGLKYQHAPTKEQQEAWHTQLAERLREFTRCCVVVRAYDIPTIRRLYPIDHWAFVTVEGRKQTNEKVNEVLIVRG